MRQEVGTGSGSDRVTPQQFPTFETRSLPLPLLT
jgi:hypothetical protein